MWFVAGAVVGVLCASVAWNAYLYGRLRRSRTPLPCEEEEERRLPPLAALLSFLRECAAFCAVLTTYPLGLSPNGRESQAAQVRIMLVPGCALTRGALRVLARRLTRGGFQVRICPYAAWGCDVPRAAVRLHQGLAGLQQQRTGAVYLVGFGAGGLVARYCLRHFGSTGVERLLTIGTPHLGTELAPQWFPRLSSLRPDSALISELNAVDRVADVYAATALHSDFDATILPPDNAYYPRAFNVRVRDVGHCTLLFSKRIADLLLENLKATG